MRSLAGKDITVTGRVEAIEPYLARAEVILVPVRTGGGQRLQVLQGMALGKAVVTTSLGAEGLDFYNVRPPLVVADTDEELAVATAALLADRKSRCELGRQAREFVACYFSPTAYRERAEAIYDELLQEVAGAAL